MEESKINTEETTQESTLTVDQPLVKVFTDCGVIASGHFQLRSGRHSDKYVNKDVIYTIPELSITVWEAMTEAITGAIKDLNIPEFDVIVAPAVAGAVLAYPIALHLGKPFAFAEKEVDKFKLRTVFNKLIVGKKVLLIEDIITSGGSIEKVIGAVIKAGGEPVAIQCIWNRSNIEEVRKVKVFSLIDEVIASWRQQDCELCQNKVPITLLR